MDDARTRIARYLAQAGLPPSSQVVALTGDASDRRYFRVVPPSGRSLVLALHQTPIDAATLPFVNVHTLLARMPLPVPAILGHADADGLLALDDLGNVTLQARLGQASPAERRALYREAVDFLVVLQRRGAELTSDAYLPYGLAFDVAKLTFELDFFVRHFLEAHRGITIGPTARETLDAEWWAIVEELAAEPRVLCHRDYHSRNLMWRDGHLYLIDFQDARMGPDTYDLASLLRDSYVDLADAERDDLVAYFLSATRGAAPADAAEFRRRFDLMSVQRNLKALGTFGYQAAVRANEAYLESVPRTLDAIADNLGRYPRFGRLRETLGAMLPELRPTRGR